MIGVRFVSTFDAPEQRLRLPVLLRHMAAARARTARVLRIHGDEISTPPCRLVFELAAKLAPTLVENRLVETGLRTDIAPGCVCRAFRRLRHVADLQVFERDHCVVFADSRRCLVEKISASVGDPRVDALDASPGLFPVAAAFDLAGHPALVLRKPLPVLAEGRERRDVRAVAHGCEAGNAHVDTDRRTLRNRLPYLAARENRNVPLARAQRHSGRANVAGYIATLAVTQPAELRK